MGPQPLLETLQVSVPAPSLPLSTASDGAVRPTPSSRLEILSHFDDVFSVVQAVEAQDIDAAYRLRYRVYCLDRAFENAAACPQGMEHDEFDDLSLHCLLRHRASDRPIGTVRLVLPPATPTWFAGLPLTEYAPQECIEEILRLPAGSTAEVSRFAITRAARDILRESGNSSGARSKTAGKQEPPDEKLLPYMSLGLIRGLVQMSREQGVTHWCLAAEPTLLRRLRNFGLHFHNAGPLVDHRGLRQVCYAELESLLERAAIDRPEFWDVMTEGGNFLPQRRVRSAA